MSESEEIVSIIQNRLNENRMNHKARKDLLFLDFDDDKIMDALKTIKEEGSFFTIESPYHEAIEKTERQDIMRIVFYPMKEKFFESLNQKNMILFLPSLEKEDTECQERLIEDVLVRKAILKSDNAIGFEPHDIKGLILVIASFHSKEADKERKEEVLSFFEKECAEIIQK